MRTWRVIMTDSESPSGVAPVCVEHNDEDVRDGCCPHPHIETWSEEHAKYLAGYLTAIEAELCS